MITQVRFVCPYTTFDDLVSIPWDAVVISRDLFSEIF